MVIGGGVSDIEDSPGGHGHWDKHGRWREDVVGIMVRGGSLMRFGRAGTAAE